MFTFQISNTNSVTSEAFKSLFYTGLIDSHADTKHDTAGKKVCGVTTTKCVRLSTPTVCLSVTVAIQHLFKQEGSRTHGLNFPSLGGGGGLLRGSLRAKITVDIVT
ncbi:unnamed protein product [Arctogadus glacialis]